MGEPECAGMLKKFGGGGLKRDQDRWFELRNKRLYYYKGKPASSSEKPLGVINLVDTKIVDGGGSKKYGWTITGPNMPKPYTLFAVSEADKTHWLKKMAESKESGHGALAVAGESDDEGDVFDQGKNVGLEDFDLLCVVGKGSFGKVMQVRKKDTKEIFAMKCMSKELILREGLVDHMKAEKNILGMINHPFIVKLHYAFQTKDSLFLILDFLSGGEVFYHLSQCNTFPEPRAKFYTAQIGLSLGHLHSLNIIYRDLKPENCVLDKDGNCCITDFGLAKPGVSSKDSTGTFCGTPEYLAPEFLTGGGHGRAVDWWSLGILLYEMITGLPPFYSEHPNEMYELILNKKLTFPDGMSAGARDLCSKLLERNPENRMQEVEAFKAHPFFADLDFEALLAGKLPVPFKPDPKAMNFENEFTDLPARHSIAQVVGGDGGEFDNFHFDRKQMRARQGQ
ncbi:RAC family serine/threonine-protein kinase-like protein [Diplonema papillatum]|nr:RAC family serine/threonine-protein kinase-like protein [Diplonema papillatum]